jgi:hypothetical protein
MRLQELARVLDLKELTTVVAAVYGSAVAGGPGTAGRAADSPGAPAGDAGGPAADADITRGYASDLLSDVLANAPAGGILVTLQVHLNVIAVAGHAGLRAVIFSSGRRPEAEVIAKAAEEGIALFASPADSFELVGRLHGLGIRGSGA